MDATRVYLVRTPKKNFRLNVSITGGNWKVNGAEAKNGRGPSPFQSLSSRVHGRSLKNKNARVLGRESSRESAPNARHTPIILKTRTPFYGRKTRRNSRIPGVRWPEAAGDAIFGP